MRRNLSYAGKADELLNAENRELEKEVKADRMNFVECGWSKS